MKYCKFFSNIVNHFQSDLQKWTICHSYVFHYPIDNDFIQLNLDDKNGGTKTCVRQSVILQVFVCELHIDMHNKSSTGSSMAYD